MPLQPAAVDFGPKLSYATLMDEHLRAALAAHAAQATSPYSTDAQLDPISVNEGLERSFVAAMVAKSLCDYRMRTILHVGKFTCWL